MLQDLAYFTLEKTDKISGKGPVGKFFGEESLKELMKICKNGYRRQCFSSLVAKLMKLKKFYQFQEIKLQEN